MGAGGNISQSERTRKIYRVTLVGFVVNLLLTLLKLVAGVVGQSAAMVADAIHSASDFATDAVVMLFVRIASKPQDEDHKYGHGKYETLASIIIGMLLAIVAVSLMISGVEQIIAVAHGAILPRPRALALWAAVISILIKEGLYWYTIAVGRGVGSQVVLANAWHHRSDALSSLGTLIGVGCAHFLGQKWGIADPIAALLVSVMIFNVAYQLTRTSVEEMLEKSLPRDMEARIMEIISENQQVSTPHELRTRRVGERVAIDAHMLVDGGMSVRDAHQITEQIEARLCEEFGQQTIISLHVEPKEN